MDLGLVICILYVVWIEFVLQALSCFPISALRAIWACLSLSIFLEEKKLLLFVFHNKRENTTQNQKPALKLKFKSII